MLSQKLDKFSFWSIFCIIVFLPIFCLPFTDIPIETSKTLLLVTGLFLSVSSYIVARFIDGQIVIPKSRILFFGFVFACAFLASAIHLKERGTSLFGVILDFGTFYFILASTLLMLMTSVLVRDAKSSKTILLGFVLSSVLFFVFQVAHAVLPNIFTLGVLSIDRTDNLLGSLSSFGLFLSFFSFLLLFVLEFFKIPQSVKPIIWCFLILALLLLVVVNFSLSWAVLCVFALIIFIFKIYFSSSIDETGSVKNYFPFVPFFVFMLSIFFFVASPVIVGILPQALKSANIDARPNFATTLSVDKSILQKSPIFGVGPNKWGEAWSQYRPAPQSSDPLWNYAFDFGSGIWPTFLGTTGYIGLAAFIIFILVLVFSGLGSIFYSIKHNARFEVVCYFFGSIFLFTIGVFYSTGPVLFLLAFAFIGLFVGVYGYKNPRSEIAIYFKESATKSIFYYIILSAILFLTLFAYFGYLERFVSVSYFRAAIFNKNDKVLSIQSIDKALSLNLNDLYLRKNSQVHLENIDQILSHGSELSKEDRDALQKSIDKSLSSAVLATYYNIGNYQNFQSLGNAYQMLGRLGAKENFSKAIDAYKHASELNPSNPELRLMLAKVAFLEDDFKNAEIYTSEAIALKKDYVDALVAMSQIKKGEGDIKGAILYANSADDYISADLRSFPNDSTLINMHQQLSDYIKTLNAPTVSNTTPEPESKPSKTNKKK